MDLLQMVAMVVRSGLSFSSVMIVVLVEVVAALVLGSISAS
jgi:hypothetical protein